MRLEGRIFKSGKFWVAEVSILNISSQGLTRAEAFDMIADAIAGHVDVKGFKVDVRPDSNPVSFTVGANDMNRLMALVVKRQREMNGLTQAEAAKHMKSSANSIARYEQGRSTPSIVKYEELLEAVDPDGDYVLRKRSAAG